MQIKMIQINCVHVFAAGLLILACGLPAAMAAEYPWQKRLDQDGIVVHTRKIENSPILEYKAMITIDASIDQVVSFYEDEKKIPAWVYQCVSAEVLENESPGQKIFYFVMRLPWPVAMRDVVYRQVKSMDSANQAVSYVFTALPDKLPSKKGKVRMLSLNTLWRFTPLPDGKTEVYFQQHSNPGGSIPPFVVNKLVVDIPFHSLKNLRKLITAAQ